jgi:hypothetical protein
MATLAGLVRPILAKPFNLAGGVFLMTDLAILQRILMLFVVEGNIAVFCGQGYDVSRHHRYRAEKGKHNCRNNLFQMNSPPFP